MSLDLSFAVFTGIVSLVIVGYAIWRAGPGERNHTVECPATKRRARVVALHVEPEFGCLQAADIVACSRLGGQPVTCGKDCLVQL